MSTSIKRYGGAAGLLASGLLAGGLLSGTFTANAATTATPSTPPAAASPAGPGFGDPTKCQRPDEHLLTGDTAAKVRAAALAKYPGATVQRVETDSDGVYEAHLLKADGTPVTVEVNKAFAVTGVEKHGPGRPGGPGPGGPAGHGMPPAGSTDTDGT